MLLSWWSFCFSLSLSVSVFVVWTLLVSRVWQGHSELMCPLVPTVAISWERMTWKSTSCCKMFCLTSSQAMTVEGDSWTQLPARRPILHLLCSQIKRTSSSPFAAPICKVLQDNVAHDVQLTCGIAQPQQLNRVCPFLWKSQSWLVLSKYPSFVYPISIRTTSFLMSCFCF